MRVATLLDTKAIVDLGMEALERDPYPGLVISRDKLIEVAHECISQNCNFAWVEEEDGEIVGAVCALVHEMTFHERKQASVVQFYCNKPDKGVRLIRKFLDWARNRRAIKMICFTLECRADPRIGKLLNRLGLKQELPVFMELR